MKGFFLINASRCITSAKIIVLDKKNTAARLSILSLAGILLFIALYILAALLFPGGSDADRHATSFSWRHNYWCELMAPVAPNGISNQARPVAIIALAVLSFSLIVFWNIIPLYFKAKNIYGRLIRICGSGSMLILPLMLTGRHDSVINFAALLGCIAIMLLLICLYQSGRHLFFIAGIICLLLCGLNNYVYYTKSLLHYLPVIQKITFAVFLLWFILLLVAFCRKLFLTKKMPPNS